MKATSRRKTPFRQLLVVSAGLALLAGGAWVAVGIALDPARVREALQDATLRATGRMLTVAGGVHITPGLAPVIELDDVALANVAGGSRPQMVTARAVRAELALLPLLFGDAVISTVTVEQPDILIERGTDGAANWVFTPPRRVLFAGQGAGSQGGGRHHVEIRHIVLVGGRLAWQPAQGAAQAVALGHVALAADSSDSPMHLEMDGRFPDGLADGGGLPFTATIDTGSFRRLRGEAVSALAGTWPVTIKLSVPAAHAAAGAGAGVPDASLAVTGGINHPDEMRSYQLRVTAHAADLAVLNRAFGRPLLPALAEVNATAVIADASDGSWRSSQLSAHAGASDLGALAPGLTVKQITLSAPGPGQLAQVNLDGTYAGQALTFAAAVMQPDVIAAGAPIRATLSAEAAGATITAQGTIPPGLDATGFDMQVDARAPDVAALSPLVGTRLPAARDLSLSAQLGDAGVKLRGIALRNLALNSSAGDVAGAITVVWAPRHALNGTLSARSLDLDALASGSTGGGDLALPHVSGPPGIGPAPAEAPPADSGNAAPPADPAAIAAALPAGGIPLAFLRQNDADLTISAGDVVFGGAHYRDVAAHLELADGKLAVNPLRAQAPDGALIGGASIDASSDQPPIAVSLRSPSIAAGAIARILGYPDGARGTMQVDMALSGTGPSRQNIEATLTGHVGLAAVNATVSDALLDGLLGDIVRGAGVPSLGSGDAQLRCLALRADFANGVGQVRALAADLSKLSLSGTGQIDLAAQTLDLHLRPRVKLGPTDVSAPVVLQGPIGAARAALDPVLGGGRVGVEIGGGSSSGCAGKLAIARNGLAGPLPGAVPADSGIKQQIRKPKDLLQGLFH